MIKRGLYASRQDVRDWLKRWLPTVAQGRANAATLDALLQAPDCPLWRLPRDSARRQLRRAISELVRRDRFPVAATSDGRGYYIPQTLDEALACYRELRGRAMKELVRAKRVVEDTGHLLGGQMTLDAMRAQVEMEHLLRAAGVAEGDDDGE